MEDKNNKERICLKCGKSKIIKNILEGLDESIRDVYYYECYLCGDEVSLDWNDWLHSQITE